MLKAETRKTLNASDEGLRARNKRDKRARIQAAAGKVFAEKGFDAATLREIAEQAQVGLGTLFAYATDKRDLVFLLFTEKLDAVTERAFRNIDHDRPFVDRLVSVFDHYLRFFDQNHALARILLKEVFFSTQGMQARRFVAHWDSAIEHVTVLVRKGQAQGVVRGDTPAALIARVIFQNYQAQVRHWLTPAAPNRRQAMKGLRVTFELLLSGFGA